MMTADKGGKGETFRDDEYIYGVDSADGLMGVFMPPSSSRSCERKPEDMFAFVCFFICLAFVVKIIKSRRMKSDKAYLNKITT